MLPKRQQYKNWSLPSKYSFIGILIGLISLIPLAIALKDWMVAVPDYAVLAYNYGTSEMTIYGAEGESPENAIIIRGANSHDAGVKAEYYWIKRRYPGYERTKQAVFDYPDINKERKTIIMQDAETGFQMEAESCPPLVRMYDVLYIQNWYGREREIYFDITTFLNSGSEPAPEHVHTGKTPNDFLKELEKFKSEQSNKSKQKDAQ